LLRRFPVLLVILSLAAGVLLHEIGHAVAGLCCGGVVSDLTLFSIRPHVRVFGHFTAAQEIFSAAAGSGAVLLVWLLTRLLRSIPRTVGDAFSCLAVVELLGWGLSATAYPSPETSHDVVRFLRAAQVPPLSVAVACLLLGLIGWLVARWTRRGIGYGA
jgi:hypothetical protein